MRESGVDCERFLERTLPSHVDYASEFIRFMEQGERAGFRKYGPFDPKTDLRVLTVEAQEEARDVGNYMRFLRRKHPDLRDEVSEVLLLAFKLYKALRQLESRERGLSESPTGKTAV